MIKSIRTWTFVFCQLAFVTVWFGINRFFPHFAFDSTFSTLQVLLLTEGCCIGSVFLMTQHRQAALDRRISVSDYIVDCQMQREIKELRPLIYALHKDMEDKKKNNFLCNGCGEPGYKCCCDEHIQAHQS